MVANNSRSGCMDDLSIAVLIFEGAEELDIVGPFEMFYWMSLFEALPPDRRPIGEPNFAVDFIGESEFADYFYPKVAPKGTRANATFISLQRFVNLNEFSKLHARIRGSTYC